MSELTQIVWFIVLFPMVCAITIFVTVLAHNKAQDWYHQRYGTDATVNDNSCFTVEFNMEYQPDKDLSQIENISIDFENNYTDDTIFNSCVTNIRLNLE